MSRRAKRKLLLLVLVGAISLCSNFLEDNNAPVQEEEQIHEYIPTENPKENISLSALPSYEGEPAVIINDNVPSFSAEQIEAAKEGCNISLSPLDQLGRCGVATGVVGSETIAEGERGQIGHIRPSGWHTVKYPGIIDDLYLYNRCHLLMWKLTGILDDERNLITGTRYLNLGMLPYENQVLDYIYSTSNHVLYRVTPVYEGNNLLASGVMLEAYSIEDNGEGLSFCIYCYNVQPGIEIDYATGESQIAE